MPAAACSHFWSMTCSAAYVVPTPLVAVWQQRAKQAGHDHGDVRKQDPQRVADRQPRQQQNVQQQQRRRDGPVCSMGYGRFARYAAGFQMHPVSQEVTSAGLQWASERCSSSGTTHRRTARSRLSARCLFGHTPAPMRSHLAWPASIMCGCCAWWFGARRVMQLPSH